MVRAETLLLAGFVAAGGCVQLGLSYARGGCSAGAAVLSPDETAVLVAAAHRSYEHGELRLRRETAWDGVPFELEGARAEQPPSEQKLAMIADLTARNERSGCLQVPEAAFEVLPMRGERREVLTLSRPGFDKSRDAAIVLYRTRVYGSSGWWEDGYWLLRRSKKRGWIVVDGIIRLP